MAEVWHLLDGPLDEAEHLILVVVDASLDLLVNLRLHRDDLLVLLLRQFSQVTVFLGLDGRSGEAVVNNGDFTEEVARSEQFLLLLRFVVTFFLRSLVEGALEDVLFSDDHQALSLGDQVDCLPWRVLLNDNSVWLAQLGLHSLNDWLDQLILFLVYLCLGEVPTECRKALLRDLSNGCLELDILFHGAGEDLDRHFLVQGWTDDFEETVELFLLILGALRRNQV